MRLEGCREAPSDPAAAIADTIYGMKITLHLSTEMKRALEFAALRETLLGEGVPPRAGIIAGQAQVADRVDGLLAEGSVGDGTT